MWRLWYFLIWASSLSKVDVTKRFLQSQSYCRHGNAINPALPTRLASLKVTHHDAWLILRHSSACCVKLRTSILIATLKCRVYFLKKQSERSLKFARMKMHWCTGKSALLLTRRILSIELESGQRSRQANIGISRGEAASAAGMSHIASIEARLTLIFCGVSSFSSFLLYS